MSGKRLQVLGKLHTLELCIISLSTELLEVQRSLDEEKRFEERLQQQLVRTNNAKATEAALLSNHLDRQFKGGERSTHHRRPQFILKFGLY